MEGIQALMGGGGVEWSLSGIKRPYIAVILRHAQALPLVGVVESQGLSIFLKTPWWWMKLGR